MKKFETIIYLLYVDTPDKRLYKIGHTTGSLYKRILSLQTGCPYEIKILYRYNSTHGEAVERTLHNKFSHNKTHGEWFELDFEIETTFISLCEKYENLNNILEKNNEI